MKKKDFLEKAQKLYKAYAESAGCIIVGILFIIFRSAVLPWILTLAGAALLMYGTLDAIDRERKTSILKLTIGLIVVLGVWLFRDVLLIMLGAFIVACGIAEIIQSIQEKDITLLIANALTIIFGALFIIDQFVNVFWIFIALGAVLIVKGGFMIVEEIYDRKK